MSCSTSSSTCATSPGPKCASPSRKPPRSTQVASSPSWPCLGTVTPGAISSRNARDAELPARRHARNGRPARSSAKAGCRRWRAAPAGRTPPAWRDAQAERFARSTCRLRHRRARAGRGSARRDRHRRAQFPRAARRQAPRTAHAAAARPATWRDASRRAAKSRVELARRMAQEKVFAARG